MISTMMDTSESDDSDDDEAAAFELDADQHRCECTLAI